MNNRHLTLSLVVALALASPTVSAMGLGQLQVKSGLDQPLVAEIPILSATPSELDQLDVRLASPEAFTRIGLERPGQLAANLQFSVGKNASGQPVILVTTVGRFSEPLLNFLIEAEWGKGTVTREYTALIDPPYIAAALIQPTTAPRIYAAPTQAPLPALATPIVAPRDAMPAAEAAQTQPAREADPIEVTTVPAQEPQPVVEPPAPAEVPEPIALEPAQPPSEAQPAPAPIPAPMPVTAPAPPAPAVSSVPPSGDYGPISQGETLWEIANQMRPEATGVSVNQMMLALLRANPDAFARDNINRLKRGSVLRVPEREELNRISAPEAAAAVAQQAAAWRSPRQSVPQPADSSAASVASAPAAARPAAAIPPRSAARLEIVPPSGNAEARGAQSGAAAGAGGTELRAELVQAREELAARTSEVTELKSRVVDMEQQDADRQRLIEMQNSQLKDLQDRLRQMETAAPVAAAVPAAANVQAADSPSPTAVANPAVAGTPWYLQPFVLVAGGLILLGALVLALRRRKIPGGSEVIGPRLSDDEALRASIARTRQAGERINPEPPRAVVAGAAPTAAAVVDKELEALKEAVRLRENDPEAHLSLLRLYHSRGNAVDYEIAAQSMRRHLPNTMDPRWREAVIMGSSLMPGNQMFSPAGWNSPRYSEPEGARAASAPAVAALAQKPVGKSDRVRVFDAPEEPLSGENLVIGKAGKSKELDLDSHARIMGETFGATAADVHRNEAELMAEGDASATRIELARAYLDIGDFDGARSMLEEVLAEGGPAARAEAGRLLKEMG